jgi:glycosyltransferase involved in cell wall biosynthesis
MTTSANVVDAGVIISQDAGSLALSSTRLAPSKPMKILFIHNFYQQFGGEDSVALAESRLLKEKGEEVLLWTRHNDEIKDYGVLQKASFFPEAVHSRHTVAEIRKVVQRFRPDVAYIHNIYPLISPSLYGALRADHVPMVQVLHDFRPFCSNGWFYIGGQVCERCKTGNHLHAIANRCYRDSYLLSALYATTLAVNRWSGALDNVDAFICLTDFFRKKIQEMGIPEEKIFVRPNFIATPSFEPETSGHGGYALFLGRLSNEKGLWTLVRAFEQLPEVDLRIVGTGPLENELKNYVTEKRLGNIHLVGFKSGDEKRHLLRDCQFAVVPSEWYENFPISALEFYGHAKPVIASRIGGLPYIVEEGETGLLFEPGNPADLVAKIHQLRADPVKAAAMGRLGRHRVETKYGPEESYNHLMNIFKKVLAR